MATEVDRIELGYRVVNVWTAQRDLSWWLRWNNHRIVRWGR